VNLSTNLLHFLLHKASKMQNQLYLIFALKAFFFGKFDEWAPWNLNLHLWTGSKPVLYQSFSNHLWKHKNACTLLKALFIILLILNCFVKWLPSPSHIAYLFPPGRISKMWQSKFHSTFISSAWQSNSSCPVAMSTKFRQFTCSCSYTYEKRALPRICAFITPSHS